MWTCPACHSRVDDSFEVCWSCGTTQDGVEDPDFVTADEAEPIRDEPIEKGPPVDDPLADFAGTPLPDLVECYSAADTIEAKFVADRLMEEGIPAVADHVDINMVMGGLRPQFWGQDPKVRVRAEDLEKTRAWLAEFEQRRRHRS
ncbi:putative signal transducing protein [Aquisphaera insulae]|uniref:putative signal transducing protein n=1 Tax=Aquisphaera insulae TaxID=2712864 RepID=UPI0013EE2CCA|nr:DUF2007 domain-containing protein [Aquisphaera insulae]